MLKLDDYERFVGIEGYSTDTPPVGGEIKKSIADFIVREITPNGAILSTYTKNRKRKSVDPRRKEENDNGVNFTIFTLIKKNTDTIHAAEILSKYLDIPMEHIYWAGNKDNTAITAQKFAVRGDFLDKLVKFKHRNIVLDNIVLAKNKVVDIGKLWGNHFTINIRNVNKPYDELIPILDVWKKEINEFGFPNFFGLQRFGQHRPNSHIVGKYVFNEDYRAACEEFLFTVYPMEYENIVQFRKKLDADRNFQWGLKNCPKGLQYEKLMLEHLAENPDDWEGAFLRLPKSLINLIMSSFQSYLFNKTVSIRMKEGNPLHKPIKGDIVAILEQTRGNLTLVRYMYHGGEGWNDHVIEKAFRYERAAVLAPIVGFKTDLTKYPVFKRIYDRLFVEESFDLEIYKHPFRGLFTFKGTFRAINRKPINLNYKPAPMLGNSELYDPMAISLEFTLTKGTYATMLIRELTKNKYN